MAWIYILESPSGKYYVGQTINIKERFYQYPHDAKRFNYLIDRAIRKYGFSNFEKYIFSDIPKKLLDYFEIELIKRLKSTNKKYGYNLDSGGNKQKTRSEITKKKISKTKILNGNWIKGKHLPEETKKKMSITKLNNPHPVRGKHLPVEWRNNLSRSLKGKMIGEKNPMYGKHHSLETKEKLSKLLKGKTFSLETRLKISKACRGIKKSEIAKLNMSKTHTRKRRVLLV